jgi:hypothetical protein
MRLNFRISAEPASSSVENASDFSNRFLFQVVGEVGLEPTKAAPADLQSAPFAARDTPPYQDGVSILQLGRIRHGFSCQKTGCKYL